MKYERQAVFNIEAIIKQIILYLKEYKRLPKVIYLPPEERVYLAYLLEQHTAGMDCFQGIPIKVDYNFQEKPFAY